MSADSRQLPRLWACHTCEMIGNQQEAHGHQQAHGHAVTELPQELSDGVRAHWKDVQIVRAAQLVAHARAARMVRGAL